VYVRAGVYANREGGSGRNERGGFETEDAVDSTEKGAAGDTAGFVADWTGESNGTESEGVLVVSRSAFLIEAEDKMIRIGVDAVTGGGEEGVGCGDAETNGFGGWTRV